MSNILQVNNPVFPEGFANLESVKAEINGSESSLQPFLASSPNLEFLSIRSQSGYRFQAGDGKIPAIKGLRLHNYPWEYSSTATDLIWDFSNLEHLVLQAKHRHSNADFLTIANAYRLPQLRKLDCLNPTSYHTIELNMIPYPDYELGVFISHLPKLEDLTIRQFKPKVLVPRIAMIGPRLRRLRMHVGRMYHLRYEDLLEVQRSCTNLETFEVHRDPSQDQVLFNESGLENFEFDIV